MKLPHQPSLYETLVATYRRRKGESISLNEVASAMAPLGWDVRALTPEEHHGGPGFCWRCAPRTPAGAAPVFVRIANGQHIVNSSL